MYINFLVSLVMIYLLGILKLQAEDMSTGAGAGAGGALVKPGAAGAGISPTKSTVLARVNAAEITPVELGLGLGTGGSVATNDPGIASPTGTGGAITGTAGATLAEVGIPLGGAGTTGTTSSLGLGIETSGAAITASLGVGGSTGVGPSETVMTTSLVGATTGGGAVAGTWLDVPACWGEARAARAGSPLLAGDAADVGLMCLECETLNLDQ